MDLVNNDSPLSTTSSVAGILTFIVALLAAAYVRVIQLRNSNEDFFKVKTSLSWYKTESTWLAELVRAAGEVDRPGFPAAQYRATTEYQMYAFVMEDLQKLEARLLELVVETEEKVDVGRDELVQGPRPLLLERRGTMATVRDEKWTLVPRGWSWGGSRTTVAMAWLPVRTKALELVRQRDALTARVLFTQMSMISSRIRDLESNVSSRDAKGDQGLRRLEDLISNQKAEVHRLEELVRRIKHSRKASNEGDSSPSSPLESSRSRRPSPSNPWGGSGSEQRGNEQPPGFPFTRSPLLP